MTKKQELEQLKGIGKILDCLWENSHYAMGIHAIARIKTELIYYFGENWTTDMYDFILDRPAIRPEMPRTLRELVKKVEK